jgi:hypothetical protein
MSAPFNIGELVVCVDASACPDTRLHAGSIYTISEIHEANGGWRGIGRSQHEKAKYAVGLIEIPCEPYLTNQGLECDLFSSTRFDRIEDTLITEDVKENSEVSA